MPSAAAYKRQQAQKHLANCEVQTITEALITTVAQFRPRSPLRALLDALDRIEGEGTGSASAAVNTPTPLIKPRLVILAGLPGCGKSVQASQIADWLQGVHCAVPSLVRDALNGGVLHSTKDMYVPQDLQAELREARKAFAQRLLSQPSASSFSSSLQPDLVARLIVNRMEYEVRQRRAAADPLSTAGAPGFSSTVYFLFDGYPSTIAEALTLEAAVGQEISAVVSLHCSPECLQGRRRSAVTPACLDSLSSFEEYWKAQHKLLVVDGAQSIEAVTRQILTSLQEE
ncbi:hypothetical protein JKF63_04927 [Porcisia hertigi]|uniref:Adenylate kinase n=1 Tax=Porcisia hertigi TaxID=2761500 RepID=A0A836IV02_9TRYP|nr:hypothetical protein JKF63_04927 [Porcisia hertigi]